MFLFFTLAILGLLVCWFNGLQACWDDGFVGYLTKQFKARWRIGRRQLDQHNLSTKLGLGARITSTVVLLHTVTRIELALTWERHPTEPAGHASIGSKITKWETSKLYTSTLSISPLNIYFVTTLASMAPVTRAVPHCCRFWQHATHTST